MPRPDLLNMRHLVEKIRQRFGLTSLKFNPFRNIGGKYRFAEVPSVHPLFRWLKSFLIFPLNRD